MSFGTNATRPGRAAAAAGTVVAVLRPARVDQVLMAASIVGR
jgi:hypothetical protein